VRSHGIALAAAVLAGLTGCGGGDTAESPAPKAPATMNLTSEAFAEGATIPERHTCDGDDVAPPLHWDGTPSDARALALVMDDPDAGGGTFVHWTVVDLPSDTSSLGAGEPPAGAQELENSFGDDGYRGPCPPEDDEPHRYVFTIYALDAKLGLDAGSSATDARDAIGSHAIAEGRLTGRFGR
jgi:Raf kinase inhibitor-like YbhB/YbcL family protein